MGKISCTSVKSLHYYNYANTVLNVQLKKKNHSFIQCDHIKY